MSGFLAAQFLLAASKQLFALATRCTVQSVHLDCLRFEVQIRVVGTPGVQSSRFVRIESIDACSTHAASA